MSVALSGNIDDREAKVADRVENSRFRTVFAMENENYLFSCAFASSYDLAGRESGCEHSSMKVVGIAAQITV